MKKNCFSLWGIVLLVLIFVSACVKEETETIEQGVPAPTIYASQENTPDTRSSITVNSEGVGKILWSPADEISVFYGASTGVLYTSTNTEPAAEAAFTTTAIIGSNEGASSNIWGLYPYNSSAVCDGSSVTTTLPATQYGVPGTFDDDLFVTIAHSTSTNLHFFNVCGGIKFSLSRDDISSITFAGNNNENLAGDISVSFVDDLPSVSVINGQNTIILTPKDGGTFAKDTYYYLVVIPQTLSGGFTMTFETETQLGTFNYTDKAITLKRSVFSKKDDIDTYSVFKNKPYQDAIDLSSNGTANCYVVSSSGSYKIRAVQGNSNSSIGDVRGAKVLWESYGGETAPEVGDIINPDVFFSDGYLFFKTNDAFREGNALIAAYSDSNCTDGNVLWSWHIWCTSDDLSSNLVNLRNNAGTIMDRNLGSTSGTRSAYSCFSLLYQYGRKDPFLGGYHEDQQTIKQAASTGEWNTAALTGYDNTVKNPTTFFSSWAEGDDDAISWSEHKNKYDPCPPGYRIPDKYVYSAAAEYYSGESSMWSIGTRGTIIGWYNGDNYSNYQSVWFPNTNALFSNANLRSHRLYGSATRDGAVWTCGGSFYSAMYDGIVNTVSSWSLIPKKTGNAVRCVTESSPVVVNTESVSLSLNSITINPNSYFDISASVFPSSANVNAIKWNDLSGRFTMTTNGDGSVRFTDNTGTIGRYNIGAYSPLAVYGSNDEWRISWDGSLADICEVTVCPSEPTDNRYYGGWYLKAKAGDTISFSYYIGDDNDGNNDFSVYVGGQLVYEDPYHYSSCQGDFSYTFEESFSGWVYLWWGWHSNIWNITTTATVLGRGEPYPSYPDNALNDRWISQPSYKFEYKNHVLTMY